MVINITQVDIDNPNNIRGDSVENPTMRAFVRQFQGSRFIPTHLTIGGTAILWLNNRIFRIKLPEIVNRSESHWDLTGRMSTYGFVFNLRDALEEL